MLVRGRQTTTPKSPYTLRPIKCLYLSVSDTGNYRSKKMNGTRKVPGTCDVVLSHGLRKNTDLL